MFTASLHRPHDLVACSLQELCQVSVFLFFSSLFEDYPIRIEAIDQINYDGMSGFCMAP